MTPHKNRLFTEKGRRFEKLWPQKPAIPEEVLNELLNVKRKKDQHGRKTQKYENGLSRNSGGGGQNRNV